MRILLSVLALCLLAGHSLVAAPDETTSPNKRYVVLTEDSPDAQAFPKIVLIDKRNSKKTVLDDEFEDFGQHWVELHAAAVEKLPIPANLDKEPYKIRGGEFVDRWANATTLWIGDSSKFRLFRYRFTSQGKLLADKYKNDE